MKIKTKMNKVNQIKLKNFPFAQHESNKQGDKPTLRIEKKYLQMK